MVRRSFYRRGRRELLIMRLRPALVWFLLLSLTRVAESEDCGGVDTHVKFCNAGDDLKLDSKASSTDSVEWAFAGKTNELPSGVTYEAPADKKKILTLPGLSAADSGTYTATYGTAPSTTTTKFSILVGAVPCNAGQPCGVVEGSSIKMDSGVPSAAVSWSHQKLPDGAKPVTDGIKFTDSNKKEMGLSNVVPDNAGTYEAKHGQTTKTFTVSVQAPITDVQIEGKASACAGGSVTLECKVTGDAETVTWKKNGSPTTANVAGKKLTISVAKPADAAKYTCRAKSYPGGQPDDSPDFTLSVSAADNCDTQQNGTIAKTPPSITTDGKGIPGAARAASCSVALLLMTSLLHLCWML
ncbi:peroxidasin homolog [Syngnathus scovelli]|uniref:peroxidasin homolog n=1 Tax=Syngnathus scovelli TaxID=161590 RepID=UPI00210F6FD1|nr:peroxidasin homolog [Syngnathus scovelli]